MELPVARESDRRGESGVAFVQLVVNDELHWAFRPLLTNDYGIDAQVEVILGGKATSRLIALQVKAGDSYFDEESLVEHLAHTGDLRTLPFDASVCAGATLDDLSEEKLAEFLERAQRGRGYALGRETHLITALTHLNLLDAGKPSHATVLLFGRW